MPVGTLVASRKAVAQEGKPERTVAAKVHARCLVVGFRDNERARKQRLVNETVVRNLSQTDDIHSPLPSLSLLLIGQQKLAHVVGFARRKGTVRGDHEGNALDADQLCGGKRLAVRLKAAFFALLDSSK